MARFSGLEHLPASALGTVLATRGARGVGQVRSLARRVAAGHEGRHSGLPLRPARVRVAARQPPLGTAICYSSYRLGAMPGATTVPAWPTTGADLPSGDHLVVVPMVRIVVEICSADRTDAQTIFGAQRCERQIQHHGVPEDRLEVDEFALVPCRLVVGLVARVVEQLLDVDLHRIGDRPEAACALPDQRDHCGPGDQYPSPTASSLSSSSTGEPSGTPMTPIPRSAGASAVRRRLFIVPVDLASSWVSMTRLERESG